MTTPGDRLAAFDTPVGRIGMLICYDKAFPEAARTLTDDEVDKSHERVRHAVAEFGEIRE